ncbi:uncharacterized protein ASPGLDRAFT_36838 [Aspergillus glaucus CBS 516.65]|uniref:Mid2 domain-containing protein n=1 Tax=Aspergillus glaucus CBS 516.65 TaxID=1160497 RepID=A0A1L9VFK3_ASPGL|nr:hypothetical protein ASPGLDRAFT_36838 [Aspergillus glaucus CBS 516.65]OJJ82717.1 hypothetical protein ASPGLDRAFT_36838 [Aspergillus glaucus CBS 516.65]
MVESNQMLDHRHNCVTLHQIPQVLEDSCNLRDTESLARAGSSTYSLRPTTATDSADWWTREVCAWGPASDVITEYTYTWTDSDGSKTSSIGEMSSPGSVNAFGIEIRWQSTDFSSVPATASATATPDSPTPTSSQDSAGSDSSSGLSSGATAGIGVGVAAGVVVVAILALFFFWFRRRKARQVASVHIPQSPHDAYPPNAYAHDMYGDGGQVAELSATRNKPFTYQKAELSSETADETS